jgi:CRISPR-associated exonuclease Cas4
VLKGAIYHFSSRRRREVDISVALREKVEAVLASIRLLMHQDRMPSPVNDKRCDHCSLKDICQPEALAAKARLDALSEALFKVD